MIQNCKVRFSGPTCGITAGKVYEIKGGFLTDDDGARRRMDTGFFSFDDLKGWAYGFGSTVEVVKEKDVNFKVRCVRYKKR